jgi:hypothetical protein
MRIIRTYTDGNFVLHHDNLDDSCNIYQVCNTVSFGNIYIPPPKEGDKDSLLRLKVRQMAIKLLPKLGVI